MRELRFWDFYNEVMTYSRNFKNMATYFIYRQKVIDADNSIEDMLSTDLKDESGKIIFEGDKVRINHEPDGNCDYIVDIFKIEYIRGFISRKRPVEIICNKFENK